MASPWYQDADKLRAAILEHGSLRRVSAAHGVARSTIQEWAHRNGLVAPSVAQDAPKWGEGRPQLVRPATREPWERVVILSDLHVPYQEHGLAVAALGFIATVDPHRVILNGDLIDAFQLSRFSKNGDRAEELQADIDERNEYVTRIRAAAPTARLDETEGNHDNRVRSYLEAQAHALHSLRALQPANLFQHKEVGINWHPGCGFLLREGFLVKHGTRVSATPNGTARAEAMANFCSGVSGHVHRAERFRKTGAGGNFEWTVSGTMSRLDPDYINGVPDWNQGILYGEFSTKTRAFQVQHVPYNEGSLHFGAARYTAEVAA